MIAELRQKSQITIPKTIVESLGLNEGDKFEIYAKDGMICIIPVVVYPKAAISALRTESGKIKEQLAKGELPVFESMEALIKQLDKNQ